MTIAEIANLRDITWAERGILFVTEVERHIREAMPGETEWAYLNYTVHFAQHYTGLHCRWFTRDQTLLRLKDNSVLRRGRDGRISIPGLCPPLDSPAWIRRGKIEGGRAIL